MALVSMSPGQFFRLCSAFELLGDLNDILTCRLDKLPPAPGTLVRSGPQHPPMDPRLVALFDWVADQLEIATPSALFDALRETLPTQFPDEHNTAWWLYFNLADVHQHAQLRRWFHEIEPGETRC